MATQDGAEARRLRGDRGRLRRRPRRREVLRHQVPQGRARRRPPRSSWPPSARSRCTAASPRTTSRPRTSTAVDKGCENLEAAHRERRTSSACRSWSRSTTSSPTPTPRSQAVMKRCREHRRRRRSCARTGPTAARAPRRWPAHVVELADSGKAALQAALSRRHAAARQDRAPSRREIYRRRRHRLPTQRSRPASRTCEAAGFGNLPICMAKTQYSFSTDPNKRGAPTGHIGAGARGAALGGRRVRRRHHAARS